jgi:hypothetical protein
MKKYFIYYTSMFLILNPINNLFSQDASLVYKNTVNSTVTILTDNGSLGSGFFVAQNIIVTNYHVVEGAKNANCYLNNSDIEYQIDGFVGVDKSIDLVLLKVSTLNRPAIKFAATSASIGQKVFVIGSPKGLPATISEGIISGMRDFEGNKLLQMTASISAGSSGGAVLNINGELLGISVAQLNDGQNLNFAIPKSYLQILLDFKKDTPTALSSLISSDQPQNESPNSYSSSIIGNPIKLGSIEVAQKDFPNYLNWDDAIKSCADLGNGWRLPTTDELNQMYNNIEILGNFKCTYWSSSNADTENSWQFNFCSDSHWAKQLKWVNLPVRAVRTF